MYGDDHGDPPLSLPTPSPTIISPDDAFDFFGFWKLGDALSTCALDDRNCGYAVGGGPKQRFMGTWSDGVDVRKLDVFDEPPPCPARRSTAAEPEPRLPEPASDCRNRPRGTDSATSALGSAGMARDPEELRARRRRLTLGSGGGAALLIAIGLVVAIVVVFLLLRGGGDEETGSTTRDGGTEPPPADPDAARRSAADRRVRRHERAPRASSG